LNPLGRGPSYEHEVTKRRVGRPVEPFELTAEERQAREGWARGRTVSQALARRARMVLGCAAGRTCTEVARQHKTSIQTVSKWRERFVDRRLDGMADILTPTCIARWPMIASKSWFARRSRSCPRARRTGAPAKLAKRVGVSQSSVSRVWRAFHLKPHRRRTFTLSNDEFFVEKVRDIVGLYLNPPDHAVVLCLGEKSQIQALERRQPVLPLLFGQPERVTATLQPSRHHQLVRGPRRRVRQGDRRVLPAEAGRGISTVPQRDR
jgi:Homeodomain-like domain